MALMGLESQQCQKKMSIRIILLHALLMFLSLNDWRLGYIIFPRCFFSRGSSTIPFDLRLIIKNKWEVMKINRFKFFMSSLKIFKILRKSAFHVHVNLTCKLGNSILPCIVILSFATTCSIIFGGVFI